MNTSRPIVSDVEVRRALREGINTQEIVELVQNGYVDAATGLLTPKTPGFIDQTKQLPFNLEAAKQRLDKAGWKPGADGIRVKDGQRLKISGAFFSNAINRALFEVIQQQVRDLGVEFIVRPIPSSAEYLQGQIRGDYDVYRWHWSLADPDVLRKDYSSAGINRLRLPPENDIDALLVKQAGTTDPTRAPQDHRRGAEDHPRSRLRHPAVQPGQSLGGECEGEGPGIRAERHRRARTKSSTMRGSRNESSWRGLRAPSPSLQRIILQRQGVVQVVRFGCRAADHLGYLHELFGKRVGLAPDHADGSRRLGLPETRDRH